MINLHVNIVLTMRLSVAKFLANCDHVQTVAKSSSKTLPALDIVLMSRVSNILCNSQFHDKLYSIQFQRVFLYKDIFEINELYNLFVQPQNKSKTII